LTVIPLYLLCIRLFKNRTIALLAALFLAVSPWHVVLSRATSEGVIGLFFMLSGLVCLVYFGDSHSLKPALLAVILLGLSYFYYHSFRVLVPLVVAPFYFYPKLSSWQKKTILAIFFLFSGLTIAFSLTKAGSGRLNQVLFTNSSEVTNRIALFTQGEGPNHAFTARIFHNKVVVYTREFLRLYADYFSPSFLFSQGGFPDRYVVPDVGLFPWIFVILLGAGGIVIFTNRSFANNLLIWLLCISPLPAAVTTDDTPNVHRALSLMIPLIIVSAIGGVTILKALYKRKSQLTLLVVGFFLLFTAETVYFWHQYAVHEQGYKSFYRNDMFREMVEKVANVHSAYDTVYVSEYDGIPLYYLFYTNTFNIPYSSFSYGGIIKKLGNIEFVDDWCPTRVKKYDANGKNVLYVNKGDCPMDNEHKILETMDQHDGARAFQFVVEIIPQAKE